MSTEEETKILISSSDEESESLIMGSLKEAHTSSSKWQLTTSQSGGGEQEISDERPWMLAVDAEPTTECFSSKENQRQEDTCEPCSDSSISMANTACEDEHYFLL